MKIYGKIIKIGGWTKAGMPDGYWIIEDTPETTDMQSLAIFYLEPTGSVYVNGIEIVPWSEARRKAIKGV